MEEIGHGEFGELCEMTTIENTPERVCVRMPVEGKRQPFGLLHGGANAVLVEHAASVLALHYCPEGCAAVGSEVTVQHLRPVREGYVEGRAHMLALSSTGATIAVEIYDSQDNHTATGTLTVVFIPPEKLK